MCVTWTQKQWQDAASKSDSKYSIVGTFQNAEGQTAIQVKELGGMFSDLYWNIYSENGQDANVYTAPGEANKRMAARGFTPVEQTTIATAAAEQATGDGQVRVQGKTLAEWKWIGKQNESLPEALHTHPAHPRSIGEERDTTDAEMTAFVNSLTIDEALEGLTVVLSGAEAFA